MTSKMFRLASHAALAATSLFLATTASAQSAAERLDALDKRITRLGERCGGALTIKWT